MSNFGSSFVSAYSALYSEEVNKRRNWILSAKILSLKHKITHAVFEGRDGFLVEDMTEKLNTDLNSLEEEFETLEIVYVDSKVKFDHVGKTIEKPTGFFGNMGLYAVAKGDWRKEDD